MNIQSVNEVLAANYPTIPAITNNHLEDRWPEVVLEGFITLSFKQEEVDHFLAMDDEGQVEVIYEKYVESLVNLITHSDEYFCGLDEGTVDGYIGEAKRELMQLGHDYAMDFQEE